VADLTLASDEYITKIKVVYGGVDEGFYIGGLWNTDNDPHSKYSLKYTDIKSLGNLLGGSKTNTDLYKASDATLANIKRDFVVGMSATQALVQYNADGSDVVINGYVSAQIARNVVLKDYDADVTETRTFEAVEYPEYKGSFKGFDDDNRLLNNANNVNMPVSGTGPYPQTGDSLDLPPYLFALIGTGLIFAGIGLFARRCRKKPTTKSREVI
jgi:hypothetical protein